MRPSRRVGAELGRVGHVLGDDVVLDARDDHRRARVALAARAAAQLVVEAPGDVPSRADDVQAAELHHALAEADVGAAARHLRGDRDAVALARPGHDRGLLGVVAGVEHRALDVRRAQRPGQPLGLGDVLRAQQHRLPRGVDLRHVRDDRPLLLLDGAVDAVGQVLADARLVGVDRADRELVELVQLLGDGDGRAGHPAQRAVAPEQGLHDDPVEHRAGGAGLEPLHGLDGGLQPVRPALQVRHAAAGVVDQLDLPVAHEVVDVAVQQRVGVERDVDRREGVRLVLGVEVDAAEAALDPGQPQRGEVHGAARRVGLVVHVGAQPPHGRDDLGVDHARVDVARRAPAAPARSRPAPSRPRRRRRRPARARWRRRGR